MGNYSFFLSWRNGILKRYEGLFRAEGDGGEDEVRGFDAGESGGRRSYGDVNAGGKEDINKKWAWFSLIYSLCKGDITKADEVINKTYIECLTWLSYEKDKNDI